MDLDFSTNSLGERNDSSTALLTSIENPLFYCLNSAIPLPPKNSTKEKRKSSCRICLIAFIASIKTLDSIPQSLTSSGRFDFHVQLPAPAALKHGAILKHEV